jgi:hypothetical protein
MRSGRLDGLYLRRPAARSAGDIFDWRPEMSRAVVVRYETRPEAADENQRLVERVYAELARDDPGGLRYATFRLADGVTFVHVAVHEGDDNPLSRTAAFGEFQRGISERCAVQPVASGATLVGAYRFLEAPVTPVAD